MNAIRTNLLEGNLQLPNEDTLTELFPKQIDLISKLWNALWYNFVKDEGSVNTTYWYRKFNDPIVFNKVLILLSKSNWIISHSIPSRNWAEMHLNKDKLLEYVTENELAQIRAKHKFDTYKLTLTESTKCTQVKLGNRTRRTGLVRTGFMKAGNTQFGYDNAKLHEYKEDIQSNLTKSMDKIRKFYPNMKHDEASYDEVIIEVLNYHLNNPEGVFTTGNNISDSRGRAISSSLKKIANPISSKDFRALLVITEA